MTGMKTLREAVVAITGASAGIGRECALAFAREGADVLISLTGMPSTSSWATLNGIEGKPGHCVLYYNTVNNLVAADVAASDAANVWTRLAMRFSPSGPW